MTLDQFDDNQTLWAGDLNTLPNALAGEAIISGCSVSKGSGDWDSDVTSGTIIVGNSEVSISSGTVTHTQPSNDADMDSGESRIDLVTVDSSDTLAITEGTAASDPATPDIPSDEVVLGLWHIANGDSTLADSDLFDTPALLGDDSARYIDGGSHEIDADEFAAGNGVAGQFLRSDGSAAAWADVPLFGDGTDGSITRSSDANENGVILATDYTVDSGTTMTVSSGKLIVMATDSIDISGTIDADGQGASGGSGGADGDSGAGGDGAAGTNAIFNPEGAGGSGGTGGVNGGGGGGDGGDGGDGDTNTPILRRELLRADPGLADLFRTVNQETGAGGGGGGGKSGDGSGADPGDDGSSPGGGGGGGEDSNDDASDGSGGSGGAGGGFVVLMAPDISVSGTITADGNDGSDGGSSSTSNVALGGGGGGGTGGLVMLVSPNQSVSGSITVSGGAGGAGGTNSNGANGGDGAAGAAGQDIRITG